jgi:hypothetical protein
MIVFTDSPIDPRRTGMCGALALKLPCASNNAHEKSSRSLMLTNVRIGKRDAHLFENARHSQRASSVIVSSFSSRYFVMATMIAPFGPWFLW